MPRRRAAVGTAVALALAVAAPGCGGGGGVIAIKEADPYRFAAFGLKLDQVKASGASTVVMACSNCRLQFLDGIDHYDAPIKIRGLAEVVAGALKED